jgi:ribosomal protein L30E
MNKEKIPKKIKELVIMRIEANMPSNLRLSIGSYGNLSKEKIIEHIEREDNIGKQIVEMHMSFLKAVASGEISKKLASLENE